MAQQGEPREGMVSKVERKDTKAGKPMLVLAVKLGNGGTGEERVSYFDDADVKIQVLEGTRVRYQVIRKGEYLNGKSLEIIPRAPPPTPKVPAGARPPIHGLSVAELEQLYLQAAAEKKVEPAFLGQISNQVRYARIETLLQELVGVFRDFAKSLQDQGTTSKGLLNGIKFLAISLALPNVLAENKEDILAMLREEGGVSHPEDVVEKALTGNDADATEIVRKTLWRLYYHKESKI